MKPVSVGKPGFTLIELLTVIAIIAVLAALLFPVFGRAREQTRVTQCISQMNEIQRDVKIYFEDNNKYPAALLGFVQNVDGSFFDGTGTPATMDQLKYKPLFKGQKYMKAKEGFLCPDSPNNDPKDVTQAVYPPTTDLFTTSGPAVRFTTAVAHNIGDDSLAGKSPYFFSYDSYDVGPQIDKSGNAVKTPEGKFVMELHYSLDWTGIEKTSADQPDSPNQLKYGNTAPQDQTVVTWCTYHVAVAHSNMIPVVLLNGTAKTVPLDRFVQQGPQNFKP